MQAVWARCPLVVAFKLAEKQRLEIGWSTIRIELLKARPVQYYRCWQYGHVRSTCKADGLIEVIVVLDVERDHTIRNYFVNFTMCNMQGQRV